MSSVEKLKQTVTGLTIIVPTADSLQVIPENELAAFQEIALEFVQQCDVEITTKDDFSKAGEMVSDCEMVAKVLASRFEEPISDANKAHKALTGTRKDLVGPFESVAAALRKRRAEWKAADDARIRREQAEAARKAREEAERVARIAREEADRKAAEAKRIADEAASKAKAEADRVAAEAAAAAAEFTDPDEAMAALAAAEEEAERAAQAARDEADRAATAAQAAADEAARAAAAPVVVERVVVAAPVKEAGVTWVDNWMAQYDPIEALKALVAAGRVEFLMVNDKAVQAAAKSQKGLANIPGVEVVNNKTERRSQR